MLTNERASHLTSQQEMKTAKMKNVESNLERRENTCGLIEFTSDTDFAAFGELLRRVFLFCCCFSSLATIKKTTREAREEAEKELF